MIYFDHAASSFPKPKAVSEAIVAAINEYGANPGRGSHALAEKARAVIEETRIKVASFFNAPGKDHVWFFQNATMALNQAICGYPFTKGDHVVTTMFEHNSVIRPLERMKRDRKIDVTYVQPNANGFITAKMIEQACTEKTKMIVVTHASNVTGAIVPLKQLADFTKQNDMIAVVDASQTAGTISIDMDTDGIDLLAFAGHKSLLGPQGIGGLISKDDYNLQPLVVGGTGVDSETVTAPTVWPQRYEAGTLNTPGIAGLGAALDEIQSLGLEEVYAHEQRLMSIFLEQLQAIEGIVTYGPTDVANRVAVVSFQLTNVSSHEVAMILDEHYQIAVRAGVHCAPKMHEVLQTSEEGLIRASFGPYNTEEEVHTFVTALQQIQSAFA